MNDLKMAVSQQLQELQLRMMQSGFGRAGRRHNPHRGQGRILAILKLKPVISQKELTYLLNMSKQSVAELIAKLERNGCVTRRPSEEDKRVMIIELTDKGANAEEENDHEGLGPEMNQALDCLTEEELVIFSDYLGRIISRFEEQFPNEEFQRRRRHMERFMSEYGQGRERLDLEGDWAGRHSHGMRGPNHRNQEGRRGGGKDE